MSSSESASESRPNAVLLILGFVIVAGVVFEVVRQTPHYTYELDDEEPREFGIFTSRLDGGDFKALIIDP